MSGKVCTGKVSRQHNHRVLTSSVKAAIGEEDVLRAASEGVRG